MAASSDVSAEGEDGGTEKLSFDTVTSDTASSSSQYLVTVVDKARRYAGRLGADLKSSSKGHAFINGKHAKIAEVMVRSVQARGFSPEF